MITKEEHEEIQARLDKITPAPWINPWNDDVPMEQRDSVTAQNGETVIGVTWHDCPRLVLGEADADFIAHAPEDMRKLLGALKEAESECCYLDLRDTKRKIEIDRDNWKRLAEALKETAVGKCDFCIYANKQVTSSSNNPCFKCMQVESYNSSWQFDEARFSTGGDGE